MKFNTGGRINVNPTILYIVRQMGRRIISARFPPVIFRDWRKEVSSMGPITMARIKGATGNPIPRNP
jgi:hypothetical protein